jgi:hypothetical protein
MLLSASLAALFTACAAFLWFFGEGPVSAVEAPELRPAQQQGLPGRRSRLKRPSLSPVGQKLLLLRRQCVDAHANGVELHCGHLVVYLPGE